MSRRVYRRISAAPARRALSVAHPPLSLPVAAGLVVIVILLVLTILLSGTGGL